MVTEPGSGVDPFAERQASLQELIASVPTPTALWSEAGSFKTSNPSFDKFTVARRLPMKPKEEREFSSFCADLIAKGAASTSTSDRNSVERAHPDFRSYVF